MRTENEDRIGLDDRLGLFIVADGMGGHTHGELAAELAVTTVQSYIESSRNGADVTWPFGYDFSLSANANRLLTSIQLANRQVLRRSEESAEYAGMGTTVAAVLVDADQAAVASVGDSRIYAWRDGRLQQLSTDDTWVGAMVRQGALEPHAALEHPLRNVLTEAAGARENIHVHALEYRLRHGDLLLLSSDGLHGVVEEEAMNAILNGTDNLELATARLIRAALERGGPDNASCILLRYWDSPNPPT